ncbi:MAG: hypothetical protein V7L20_32220 [Nostoc sp.]
MFKLLSAQHNSLSKFDFGYWSNHHIARVVQQIPRYEVGDDWSFLICSSSDIFLDIFCG